jgi:RNA polymerase sigma-32 factor
MQATLPLSASFPVPMPTGSLEAYISTVNRFPLLSADEERSLARRLRDDNDLDAARQMVLSHLRLVVAVARGYLGYGLPHADLIQEGNIGLMKAVKVATTKAQRKLFFNLRSMKKGLAPLSRSEVKHIAAELKVKPEEVTEMETRLAGQEVTFEADQDDEEAYAPVHYLAADSDAEPAQVLEAKQSEQAKSAGLESALTSLDPRSRRIIEARWLREKDGLTLHDLAAEFNVSAERIRQIEVKALEKMRKALPAPV